ncbi:hypothetical protein TNCV_2243441 [Trichonephila clavipes]|nr:hypothetical protein TNCV_2243441 [Trichonephila clavipes]
MGFARAGHWHVRPPPRGVQGRLSQGIPTTRRGRSSIIFLAIRYTPLWFLNIVLDEEPADLSFPGLPFSREASLEWLLPHFEDGITISDAP